MSSPEITRNGSEIPERVLPEIGDDLFAIPIANNHSGKFAGDKRPCVRCAQSAREFTLNLVRECLGPNLFVFFSSYRKRVLTTYSKH